MKKIIAISLLTLISLKPILYVGQVVYFQLNIGEIIEKYCVNKDKPQLECNGKCHLAKQLSQYDNSATDEANTLDTINTKEIFTLVYFVNSSLNLPKDSLEFSLKNIINSYKNDYSYLRISSCFRPPASYLI